MTRSPRPTVAAFTAPEARLEGRENPAPLILGEDPTELEDAVEGLLLRRPALRGRSLHERGRLVEPGRPGLGRLVEPFRRLPELLRDLLELPVTAFEDVDGSGAHWWAWSERGAGGLVENIRYTGITMKNVEHAIVLDLTYVDNNRPDFRGDPPKTPAIRDILIDHVTIEGSRNAGRIIGLPAGAQSGSHALVARLDSGRNAPGPRPFSCAASATRGGR